MHGVRLDVEWLSHNSVLQKNPKTKQVKVPFGTKFAEKKYHSSVKE